MRSPLRRLPILVTTVAVSSTVFLAAPASAAPVEGRLTAHTGADHRSGCEVDSDDLFNTVRFTNRTGQRTAEMDQDFVVTDADVGGAPVAVTAHATIETTASARVRNRAFRKVDVESTGVVVLSNASAAACATSIHARSEAAAQLKVRKRGRIRIEWDGNVDLDEVSLTGPAGSLVDLDPTDTEGAVTVRVRPGTFDLASAFGVSLDEADVPASESRTRIGYYTLEATYLPPA